MSASLKDLAALTQGELAGRADVLIRGVASIEDVKEGELTFVLEDKNLALAENSKAAALIVSQNISSSNKPLIRVANPRLAMARILTLFYPRTKTAGLPPNHFIAKSARIGKNALIYPGVYVGEDVVIGNNCVLHPNVVVYDRCIIGDRVILHAGKAANHLPEGPQRAPISMKRLADSSRLR